MRCFVGLEIPEAASSGLDLALAGAIRESPSARWIPARNRHLTLVFLGPVEPGKLGSLREALGPVFAAGRPLRLGFDGGGVFPAGKPARVVWVGLRPAADLSKLQRSVAGVCEELGFPVEGRPFVPHLTLARCRPSWPAAAGVSWRRRCAARLSAAGESAWFGVDRAVLFESRRQAEGVRYQVIQAYPLGRESRGPRRRDDSNS